MLIVGIFHSYAHEHKCQMAFSPRNIAGIGLADGENNERLWSEIRHAIASNRVAGAYTRRQTLTNLNLAIGNSRVRNFPHSVRKKLRDALRRGRQAQKEVNQYCVTNNITIEELAKEEASMKAFFLTLSNSTIHIEDDICEHLHAIEDFKLFAKANEQLKLTCGQAWVEFRLNIALKTDGRIHQGLDVSIDVLQAKLDQLLQRAGQTMEDWIKDGVKTQLYQDRSKGIALSSLRRLRTDIWKALVSLKQEIDSLHKSSHLGLYPISICLISRKQNGS